MTSPKPLRVYSWNLNGWARAICAAHSRAEVVRLCRAAGFHATDHDLATYGGWSGNASDQETGRARPGVVLVKPNARGCNDWLTLSEYMASPLRHRR